jgi:hypothetical protein
VPSEKMPHVQPALRSRGVQQFAEAGLKGEFDSGGHESVRGPMEKMPHGGNVQDRPHCGAPG